MAEFIKHSPITVNGTKDPYGLSIVCVYAAALNRRSIADIVGKRAEELALPMQRTGLSTIESQARYIPETMKDRNSRFRADGAAVRSHEVID